MSSDKKTLLILDSNALIHRSFHALPDFRTPRGELVNAVYGFSSILLKVLKEFQPEYVAAAFDVAGPTFRDEEFAEYKAKRPKAPDELYAQIPLVKRILAAFNISIYENQGFEADDVIGTIAKLVQKRQAHPRVKTIIASGDLDTLQLVDAYTNVYTMRKGLQDTVLYDIGAVKKRFGGVGPEQMADYKGLRGDPSDNIPGVTGIGEKTAIQLLLQFVSLDNIYKEIEENSENAKKLKPKLREKLVQYKDQAMFSRELATIRLDVPIEFAIKDLEWKDFDRLAVEQIFKGLGFRSLLARLPTTPPPTPPLSKGRGAGGTRAGGSFGKIAPLSLTRREEGERGSEVALDPALEKIEQLYKENILSKEVYDLEKKLAPILRAMEKTGIKIDKKYFAKLAGEINAELAGLEKEIYKTSGKEFNINSPQQLSQVLFSPAPEGLGLSVKGLKKTPGGVVSTAAPELEKLTGRHKIIDFLLKYRELQKLFSTYIKPLPEAADRDNRIHTTFNSFGAATGRLSSSEPNLQNIPVRGEWGAKIRKGFVAETAFHMVSFDYSQVELRIAAHISGDKKLKEYFAAGEDIHTMTAAEVFGTSKGDVTKDMRFRAKALNFGVLYGMGPAGFAKNAGVARNEAQAFIDSYFIRFPAIRDYIEKTKDFVRKNGYAQTLLGRKRYLPDINSKNPPLRAQAERMAINHPIQGTSADIIKMAMVAIANSKFKIQDSRLLLQIHDELLFEIADDKVKETVHQIHNIMENVYKLTVPLKVDVSHGHSWGELKPWQYTQQ